MLINTSDKMMVIMAHPDDAELLCFGTICKYSKKGYAIKLLVITSGEKAGKASIREQEVRLAFANFKNIVLEFGNFPDGDLQVNNYLISYIEKSISEFAPQIIITHYIDYFGYDHQDHVAVAKAVVNVTYRQSIDVLLHAEPHCVKTDYNPNYFVDITEYREQKSNALLAHKSQSSKHYFNSNYQQVRAYKNSILWDRNVQIGSIVLETFFCSKYTER